ncbi:TolC family protein [Pedobacter sp. SD-b]|uniref:TolC family protein n=1 Tax=Pedobacter segetis TaxID=2793069 RepID=A0ABS1BM58_9SPHI|nr:TolC family protein [Pedobacter segetis]MBK0383381.1 TolC family protein [Pedobacter segetis]
MKSKLIYLALSFFWFLPLRAQQAVDTLSWSGFFNIIKKYHPISQQANLLVDLAKVKRTKALGGFDPKIEADFDQKYYDGTEYYTFFTPQIKLPLWYGVELKGSYSQAEGAYLNPESKLPKQGLSYVGINFNVGKGLFIDERRAAIKQAKIFEQSSQNEKRKILNDLFLEAATNYIEWYNNYKITQIHKEALSLAKTRFDAVKTGFKNGDKPAIDTVEALLMVQQREGMLQQAQLELQNSKLMLCNYLWLQNNQAVDANKLYIVPPDSLDIPLNADLQTSNNPKLLSYEFKINDLNVERRLKAESLKPELGLQLGVLNQGKSLLRNINGNYWQDNNKVNIRFSFPLTFAKARADLAETKIKIRQTQLEQDMVRNELVNKMRQNNFEILTLQNQVNILNQTYKSSMQLLNGEELKFKFGDSSLFLINSRESKLIEVREKLLATEAKLKKSKIKTIWLAGNLYLNI